MMTPEQALELAKRMREAGVQRFVLTAERFSAVLLPPPPKPVDDLNQQIAELHPKQRKELLEQAKREWDSDLYGAQ